MCEECARASSPEQQQAAIDAFEAQKAKIEARQAAHEKWLRTIAGLNPDLNMKQSCADFYLLERLAFDGFRGAKWRQEKLEAKLSTQFSNYLTIAVGGELRHLISVNQSYDVPIPSSISKYIEAVTDPRTEDGRVVAIGREAAWKVFVSMLGTGRLRLEDALAAGVRVFTDERWKERGVGGPMWGACAGVLLAYRQKKMKPRTFIDRCWTLEHNNGCVFDKVYNVRGLKEVLEIQARNDYVRLTRFASPDVRSLWLQREREDYEQHDPVWLGVQRPEVYE